MIIRRVEEIEYDVNSVCLQLGNANPVDDDTKNTHIFVNDECVMTVVKDNKDRLLVLVD